MVVKVYISGMSGNKEVKKRQQRVLMILDSKNIKYEVVDIAEPGKEAEKEFMHANSSSTGATCNDPTPRHPLPPQIYNDTEYCGDYDSFDLHNEVDTLEQFLKVEPAVSTAEIELSTAKDKNGHAEENKENSEETENREKVEETVNEETQDETKSKDDAGSPPDPSGPEEEAQAPEETQNLDKNNDGTNEETAATEENPKENGSINKEDGEEN
uniref:Uncharacterized protein n=1 Tax=Lutzomyia longipalpis TaxID=7200 RepID=A0A1B0CVU6_LUTLO